MLYPFMCHQDEKGNKAFGDGLAPMLTPQARTTGFGYEHTPPEVEVIAAFETFKGGAGFDLENGDHTVYSHTRGIDMSWEDNAVVALKRRAVLESDGTAIGAAPVDLFLSSLGLFMLAGAYIYQWDLSTTAWVQRQDSTATFSGVAFKDMIELDGVLYASRGSTADYQYSTNGTTWTAFTDADENADVWATRGNGSDIASVYKALSNIIKGTVSGINGGTSWAGGDELGHTSEIVRSAVTVDNDILVFKDRGIYLWDGTNVQDLWKTNYVASNNGANAFLWVDRKAYVPYGQQLLQFDNNPNAIAVITVAYPSPGMNSQELRGTVTAVGGDNERLYIALKNYAGDTYLLKGHFDGRIGRWVWHTIAHLGANDCNTLLLVAPGTLHSSNPAIVFGYGTAAHYIVLPRQGMRPSDDSNCTFETAEGVAYGGYADWGGKTTPKFLNRGAVLGDGMSAGRSATLKYEADRSGTETTLVTATANGLNSANVSAEVSFSLLRYVLYAQTGDTTATPSLDGWVLGATLNPRRRRMWQPTVVLSDNIEFRDAQDGQVFSPNAATMRKVIFGAVEKRVTLTDRDNVAYTVRLHDITPVALQDKDDGGAESEATAYQLVILEISALTSDEQVGVYDESDYDAGHVAGDV